MSNLEELEVKNVCSLSCDAPTNMCSLLGDHTCGNSGTFGSKSMRRSIV